MPCCNPFVAVPPSAYYPVPDGGVTDAATASRTPDPMTELELEVAFGRGAGVPGLDVLHVHTGCYALRALVCDNVDRCA